MTSDPLERLLADLVAIPSMNPMGRPRTGSDYSEAAVADFLAEYLRRHRIETTVEDVFPGRPNVIGYLDAGCPETVLLDAHMDTVHADNMEIDPFTPVVSDGRLFGRGACDTKGSLAAFVHAVCRIAGGSGRLRYNVIIAAVADEEYQFSGARRIAESGLKATFGISGEPTQLRIVRLHKGVTRWRVFTDGMAAHSAYPGRGKNAIYSMARVIQRLEDHAADLAASGGHPLLGNPTLSVGVIEGGQAVNVVPDRCMIEIDRRTLPGEDADRVIGRVRTLLDGLDGWRFEQPHVEVAGMEVEESSPVVRGLGDAIRSVTGSLSIEAAHYATDAGIYNASGTPTVVFGPGDIAQAHTGRESIDLSQLHQAADIIHRFLTK